MANISSVGPRQAKRLVDEEGYTYVDVRSVDEFESGHPTGSTNVPIAHLGPGGMVPNPDFLRVMEANFTPDAKLVLGCKSGGRSMRAAEALAGVGFTNLVNMEGGFGGRFSTTGALMQTGWQAEGLPVSRDEEGGTSYAAASAKAG